MAGARPAGARPYLVRPCRCPRSQAPTVHTKGTFSGAPSAPCSEKAQNSHVIFGDVTSIHRIETAGERRLVFVRDSHTHLFIKSITVDPQPAGGNISHTVYYLTVADSTASCDRNMRSLRGLLVILLLASWFPGNGAKKLRKKKRDADTTVPTAEAAASARSRHAQSEPDFIP